MFELDLDADLMAILVASEARERFDEPEDCTPEECDWLDRELAKHLADLDAE